MSDKIYIHFIIISNKKNDLIVTDKNRKVSVTTISTYSNRGFVAISL